MSVPQPPIHWAKPDEHRRKLALAVRGLLNGKANNTKRVTLTEGEITIVTDSRVTIDTIALLQAETASAAAALASVYVVTTQNTITIHHDPGPSDRIFGLVLVG